MDYSVFREKLQKLMNSHGIGKKELADAIDVNPATITRYLNSTRIPDLEYVIKLSEYFHVSVDWILGVGTNKYSTFSPEMEEIANLYSTASESDRNVISVLLNKYKGE